MANLQLSPRVREGVDAWLANRLVILCGGLSVLVLVPAIEGKAALSPAALAVCGVSVLTLAISALVIKYFTAERLGESIGHEHRDD